MFTRWCIKFFGRLALLALGVILVSGCSGAQQAVRNEGAAVAARSPWEASGIRIEKIKHAVAGQMLDVRYSITDMGKALTVLKQGVSLALIDQATGIALTVPNLGKVGKLRNLPKDNDPSRHYWMFFGNSGGLVKHGSKVTFVAGDVQIKDIIVE